MADDEHGGESSGALFARLTMSGRQFDGARIPVRSLEELLRYQKLVLQAAVGQWREDNEGEELPADFEQNFELVLADVEDGSAVSVLERPRHAIYEDYYDQGRELVENELDLAGSDSATADVISLLEYKEFREFGSTLEDDESIEISTPASDRQHGRVIRFTPETSRRITEVLYPAYKELSKVERQTEHGWIVGRLTAINAERKNYTITTERYGSVLGKYQEDEILDELKAVLDSSEKAPVVRIFGRLRFAGSRLKRILSSSTVQVLGIDGQPWSRRFIELANLEAGWNDDYPDSDVIAFTALDGARQILQHVLESGLAQPGVFPTIEGGVSLEWATSQQVTTVEITPDSEFELFHLTREDENAVSAVTTVITEVYDFVDKARV